MHPTLLEFILSTNKQSLITCYFNSDAKATTLPLLTFIQAGNKVRSVYLLICDCRPSENGRIIIQILSRPDSE